MFKNTEWIFAIIRTNAQNMAANKKAFWSLMSVMCLQNLIYLMLWMIVFSRISSLRGWGFQDVSFLFAAGAIGYGVFFTIFGGLNLLGNTVQNGDLDIYLARPRPVLISVLLQRMRADSLGDIMSGSIILLFFTSISLAKAPLVILLSLSTGMVFASVRLICHSFSFWGTDGETGENGFMACLIAGTNPQNGFAPWFKLVLLTLFPVGYIGLLPVEILRDFRWDWLLFQLLGSSTVFAFSLWLFYRGLKRYASGNRFLVVR